MKLKITVTFDGKEYWGECWVNDTHIIDSGLTIEDMKYRIKHQAEDAIGELIDDNDVEIIYPKK